MNVAPPSASPMKPNTNKRTKNRKVVIKSVGRPWITPKVEATTKVSAPSDDAQKTQMHISIASPIAILIVP